MSKAAKRKRKSEPNPLFLKYLTEMRDDAKQKGNRSAKNYHRAILTLKKYPMPLQSAAEARILQHFGPKVCKLLEDRLAKDAAEVGISPEEYLDGSGNYPIHWFDELKEREKIQNSSSKNPKQPAAKRATKQLAKNVPKQPTKRATKQKCLKESLVEKETYAEKTTSTTLAANECIDLTDGNEEKPITIDDIVMTPSQPNSTQSTSKIKTLFTLSPGTFKVVLCVDIRETHGHQKKSKVKKQLDSLNIEWSEKNLQLGDFVWVAREVSTTANNPPRELILDYIIERKCLSDLTQSILDGRYHEQKNRLSKCGLKNIIYLLEDFNQLDHQSLPAKTLRQAIYNTQVIHDFRIKHTNSIKETCQYLEMMTEQLNLMYGSKTLEAVPEQTAIGASGDDGSFRLMEFKTFNSLSRKNVGLSITECFMRQLTEISSLSGEKAEAITNKYPTPLLLYEAYQRCADTKEKENLLTGVPFGFMQQKMGKTVSKALYLMFNNTEQ